MPRGNGGIVGPVNTTFSGVWSLLEAQIRRSANTWPSIYSSSLSESATGTDAISSPSGYVVVQTFTATSTWTCPTGVTEVDYLIIGGGGGGGRYWA